MIYSDPVINPFDLPSWEPMGFIFRLSTTLQFGTHDQSIIKAILAIAKEFSEISGLNSKGGVFVLFVGRSLALNVLNSG